MSANRRAANVPAPHPTHAVIEIVADTLWR
jgi:hypothetical protein